MCLYFSIHNTHGFQGGVPPLAGFWGGAPKVKPISKVKNAPPMHKSI